MAKYNIEKNTLGYRILYKLVKLLHNCLYNEVIIINKQNNKLNQAEIYTPNHQNALMDALAITFAKDDPLVFLARSDIFKKKLTASILYFLKILPIYRIRDGYNSLKNNQEIFDNTVRVLKSGRGLCILPEGSHEGIKRLRQLKKGFARIAFASEIAGKKQIDVSIVPVAIDYTNYTSFNARLTVVFGKPFSVEPFMADYNIKQEVAINKLKTKLSNELKDLMLNCESESNYNEIITASEIYAENKYPNKPQERFELQRKTIKLLDKQENLNSNVFNSIIKNTKKLKDLTKSIPNQIIGLPKNNYLIIQVLLSLLFIPVVIPGTVMFGIFWYWPILFVNKKIADPQFRTSFRFVLYIIQLLIILIALLITLLIILPLKSAAILYITTILMGVVAIKIWQFYAFVYHKLKWQVINITNKYLAIEYKLELIKSIDKLITNSNE